MKLYLPLVVVLAFFITIGCKDAGPALADRPPSPQPTAPPVSQEENYRLCFFQAFETGGIQGVLNYAQSFSWFDDTERHAFCNAVSQKEWTSEQKWQYAKAHLPTRFEEFKALLAQAGYPKEFPSGDQLFKIGQDWYNNQK